VDYLKMELLYNNSIKLPIFILSCNSDFYDFDNETRLQLTPNSQYDHYVEIIDKNTLSRLGFFLLNKNPKKSGDYFFKNKIEIT
jgi:hypothetical protein